MTALRHGYFTHFVNVLSQLLYGQTPINYTEQNHTVCSIARIYHSYH